MTYELDGKDYTDVVTKDYYYNVDEDNESNEFIHLYVLA